MKIDTSKIDNKKIEIVKVRYVQYLPLGTPGEGERRRQSEVN